MTRILRTALFVALLAFLSADSLSRPIAIAEAPDLTQRLLGRRV